MKLEDLLGYPADSSFTNLLEDTEFAPRWEVPDGADLHDLAPEATTVIALRYDGGVVMVGDRQATMGYSVAHRRMQKVFAADDYSAVAVSGTAGLAIEMVRLFQTELEHYEKLEGLRLSLDGKANYLARMIRGQLSLAFQGLVVIPIFAGYESDAEMGRLYTFDVVGGTYEEQDYAATGSGSNEARAYLRNHYEADLPEEAALTLAVKSLVAAAEEDTATGGPDPRRGIYPSVVTVTESGYSEADDDVVATVSTAALEDVR